MAGFIYPILADSLLDIDIAGYMPLLVVLLVLLCAVFLLFRLVHVNTSWLWRLLVNGLLGVLMMLVFNVFFYIYLDMEFFCIPITWASAIVAGVLGIPGVLLLLVLKILA